MLELRHFIYLAIGTSLLTLLLSIITGRSKEKGTWTKTASVYSLFLTLASVSFILAITVSSKVFVPFSILFLFMLLLLLFLVFLKIGNDIPEKFLLKNKPQSEWSLFEEITLNIPTKIGAQILYTFSLLFLSTLIRFETEIQLLLVPYKNAFSFLRTFTILTFLTTTLFWALYLITLLFLDVAYPQKTKFKVYRIFTKPIAKFVAAVSVPLGLLIANYTEVHIISKEISSLGGYGPALAGILLPLSFIFRNYASNLSSAWVLATSRAFDIGDRVKIFIEDKEKFTFNATIENVDIYYTHLRLENDELIKIVNERVRNALIINYSRNAPA